MKQNVAVSEECWHGDGQSGKSTASLGVGWIGGGQWKQNITDSRRVKTRSSNAESWSLSFLLSGMISDRLNQTTWHELKIK